MVVKVVGINVSEPAVLAKKCHCPQIVATIVILTAPGGMHAHVYALKKRRMQQAGGV